MKILVIATLFYAFWPWGESYDFKRSQPMPELACQDLVDAYNGSQRVGSANRAYCEDALKSGEGE